MSWKVSVVLEATNAREGIKTPLCHVNNLRRKVGFFRSNERPRGH